MSPRWSLRASSPQLPKLGMELKINTMDGELIEVGSSEAARKVILLHGLTGTGSVIKPVAEYLRRSLGNDYSFLLPTASVISILADFYLIAFLSECIEKLPFGH